MAQQFAQIKPSRLAGSGITSTATSITLNELIFRNSSDTVVTADIGTTAYATIEPGNNEREEIISFTGVTQNGDGTATLTGVTRGLDPASPYTAVTALRKAHAGNVQLVVSNNPQVYNDLTSFNEDETITGTWTFTNPNYPRMDTATPDPTADEEFATKKYADDLAIAGAPDATTTVKGIVEIATDAELQAGTATGGTGANLAAHGSSFNETAAANKVPVADSSGKIGSDWGGAASSLATLDGSTLVVENPANATATPTASKIPIADGSGLLDGWITHPQDNQVFTSSGTWNKPTGVTFVQVICIGAGGGGGAGGSDGGTNFSIGGSGGGGGSIRIATFNASDLGATETITVGAGGAALTNGGNSSFGAWLIAYGGGGGQNGTAPSPPVAAGGGGGAVGAASGATGGTPSVSGANATGSQGPSSSTTATYNAEWGGATGGHSPVGNNPGQPGGSSIYAAPGGASGGHFTNVGPPGGTAGGAGGTTNSYTAGGGGAGGAAGHSGANATDGTDGSTNAVLGTGYTGSGGGGGGGANTTGNGGAGGDGGAPGAGAGGGGGTASGTVGAGGTGGRGEIRVYSW